MDDTLQMPPKGAHVHLMGICGVGMSSLAGVLKEKGYTVTGSDQNTYPPISTFLERLSIPVKKGYSPSNLHPRPDLVIVGNVITRDNPEADALLQLALPYLSMPQALKEFAMNGKKSIVIAGTHGKTTVSALTAWILEVAGMDPSFMIGGIAKNFSGNFKLGGGLHFIVEGDEYDTAFFDKAPKFLHYNPHVAVITSIEFDHGDIYRDIAEIKDAFTQLIQLIPSEGVLCANVDEQAVKDAAARADCPCLTYAIRTAANLRAADVITNAYGTTLTVLRGEENFVKVSSHLYGEHNIYNMLAAVAVAYHLHIEPHTVARAIKTFEGAKKRLETIGSYGDILVIDDFAHHPTAVREATKAVKGRYGERRLIAVFEPRSNTSRRSVFQTAYATSFDAADLVTLPEPQRMEKIPPAERFSSVKLKEELIERGIEAHYFPNNDELLEGILSLTQPGDVILIMSNGPFDNLSERLVASLKRQFSSTHAQL
jgi:UDP-N-acetylmuramate: L-alanyl-gamma-D-glutamyl-meso-diaminopimelate ligase